MEISGSTPTLPFDVPAYEQDLSLRAEAAVSAVSSRVLAENIATGNPGLVVAETMPLTAVDLKPVRQVHEIKEYQLANGLRVIMVPDGKETFRASLLIKSGSHQDPPGLKGIAHLLEHNQADINNFDVMKILMGEYFAGTGTNCTQYTAEVASEFEDIAFGEIAKILEFRERSAEEFEREKSIVLSEIGEQGKDDDSCVSHQAELQILSHFFNENDPRRYSINGIQEDVKATKIDDLRKLHAENYVPNKSILILSGNSIQNNFERLLNKTRRHFDHFERSNKIGMKIAEPLPKWGNLDQIAEIESSTQGGFELILPLPTNSNSRQRISGLIGILENKLASEKIQPKLIKDIQLGMDRSKSHFVIKVLTSKYLRSEEMEEIVKSIEKIVLMLMRSPKKDRVLRGAKQTNYEYQTVFDNSDIDKGAQVEFIEQCEFESIPWDAAMRNKNLLSVRRLRADLKKYFNFDNAKKLLFIPGKFEKIKKPQPDMKDLDLNPEIKIPEILRDEKVSKLGDISLLKNLVRSIDLDGKKVYLIKDDFDDIVISTSSQTKSNDNVNQFEILRLIADLFINVGVMHKGRFLDDDAFQDELQKHRAQIELSSGLNGKIDMDFSLNNENLKFGLMHFKNFLLSNNVFFAENHDYVEDQFQKLKERIISEKKAEMQNPKTKAEYLFLCEILPAGHPWRPLSIEELEKRFYELTLDKAVKFLKENFDLNGSTFIIKGDITESRCRKEIFPILNKLQTIDEKSMIKKNELDIRHEAKMISSQVGEQACSDSSIISGNAFNRENFSNESLDLLMPIIEQLINRKLTSLLREQSGLVYDARMETFYNHLSSHGYYQIATSTEYDSQMVSDLIEKLLMAIVTEGFTDEEIAYGTLLSISKLRKELIDREPNVNHLDKDPQALCNEIKAIKSERVNELLRTMIKPKQLVKVVCA